MSSNEIIKSINTAVHNKSVFWKDHILLKMRQRGIAAAEVLLALENFTIIDEYQDDRPFPSYLLLGYANGKPLHLVLAVNNTASEIHLITVYIPDSSIWTDGFRRRK